MDISKNAPFRAYKGKKPFLFISYAHKNSDLVFPFLVELEAKGYRIWYDEGIEPGTEWPEAIASAIESCCCVLVFISPDSVLSRNVSNEINFALNTEKKMICIHLRETVLPKGLALQTGGIQSILLYRIESTERFWQQLTDSLPECAREEKKESRQAAANTKPEAVASEKKPRRRWWIPVIAAATAAIFFLAVAFGPLHLFHFADATAAGQQTISILYTGNLRSEIPEGSLRKANEDFMRQYPQFTVEMQYVDASGDTLTAQQVVDRMKTDQPSILITDRRYTDALVKNQCIADLSGIVGDLDQNQYYCLDQMHSADGVCWSVVSGFRFYQLAYNQSIFNGIGLTLNEKIARSRRNQRYGSSPAIWLRRNAFNRFHALYTAKT